MLQNVIAGGSVRRYVVCHSLDSALTVFVTNRVEVQGGFWWVWGGLAVRKWRAMALCKEGVGIQLIKD